MSSFHALVLPLFYFFAAIAIWLGLTSLRGGVRFVRYLQAAQAHDLPEFTPVVSVFLPCRGLDEGLSENVSALFEQDYPAFEIIVVSDRKNDPALRVIEAARRSFRRTSGPTMRVLIAGPATDSGQKAHNLRLAVREADPKSKIFAFMDTDARPGAGWLRELVAALADEQVGAATGYRWFIPVRGGFASHLLSVWNASIASALGSNSRKNFCWGGSSAIRREIFERLDIGEKWRGIVSDDFVMTRALHEAGWPIKFVPRCLTASLEDCTLRKLLEFTTRQLRITRTYAPHLWGAVLAGSLLFGLAFFGGIVLVAGRAAMGLSFATPLALLLLIFALGTMKSHLRLRAVSLVIPEPSVRSRKATLAHMIIWPLASAIYLYDALAALFSRRITWRGITYELKSPTEAVIIRRGGVR